ncbi:hypothetical protein PBI_DAMIEN_19 [Mycobacterium phage Damien]|uniref:hypothetical protein n=1 Tax=Mycobacterium phage Damien TaxID=1486469 RepID=UPI00045F7186|nr:hypothetical protein HL12_gp19 [Mycobacterium phage Damien]AHZ95380.1 hypothetical protein PBI_DAMIEN_19 [Mycobacterium phage Damien]
MARVRIDFDHAQLHRMQKKIRNMPQQVNQDVSAVVDYNAAYGQAHMRTNAPWTDRTGAARSGLFALPGHYGKLHEIFLTYSVYYGIWLEVANSGKYQILQPTLLMLGRKLMRDVEGIMDS